MPESGGGAVAAAVLDAYQLDHERVEPVDGGLINRTFSVFRRPAGGEPKRHILQRVNPMFDAAVHLDIEAITDHLEKRGLATPRLRRTVEGALWYAHGTEVWRLLTYVPGKSVAALPSTGAAAAAGAAVGRFHTALSDLEHRFAFSRPDAHDTPRHLAHLTKTLDAHRAHPLFEQVAPVASAILAHGAKLPGTAGLPVRIIHGDLKCLNLRFTPALDRVVALLDLDTLAHSTLAIEMGDALRSWCNPLAEDAANAHVSVDLFAAAVGGYLGAARALLSHEEKAALVPGMETIAVELSARFCADALAETYFGWDASRYDRAGAHNLARARGQLALAASVRAQRAHLERSVTQAAV